MIEDIDYTLNDVYGHEGKFTVWNVRCPKCNLGPGMRCDKITIPCIARKKHFNAVNEFFNTALFPHSDHMSSWDLNAWVAHNTVWLNTNQSARMSYRQARINALDHSSLKALRLLHEFMDFRAKYKLKGNAAWQNNHVQHGRAR